MKVNKYCVKCACTQHFELKDAVYTCPRCGLQAPDRSKETPIKTEKVKFNF